MSEITLHPSLPAGAAALRPLFVPLDYHRAITAVLDGRSPGHIFSDSASAPRVALLWTQQRAFLAGDAQDPALRRAVRAIFEQQFRADAAARRIPAFTLAYTEEWAPHVDDLLAAYYPLPGTRHAYEREAGEVAAAGDFDLWPVDGALLARADLAGLEELLAEMQSERPSVTDFLMKSFGTVAVADGAIIGWCLSEYNTADCCELGVATAVERRRQGVGSATSAATITRAERQGIRRVGWHCWADNAPSIALARALDFELRAVYPVAFAYVDPQQGLAVRGFMALEEGELSRARGWLERAAALGPLPAWALVHQARLEAAGGRTAVALDLLEQAAQGGFTDFAQLEPDPYLAAVRATSRWATLRGA